MKKLAMFLLVAIAFSVSISSDVAQTQNVQKVLLIPRGGLSSDLDLMLEKEVGLMITILEEHGFEVEIATASAEPIKGNNVPINLMPDFTLSEVVVSDYAGIIMPCMAVGLLPGPPVSPIVIRKVKEAVEAGKPIAAQLGSVQILAEAGVLKTRGYAFSTNPLEPEYGNKDPRFYGAIYKGVGVVKDGNIITSGMCPFIAQITGMPDGTAELTEKLISEIVHKSEN